MISQLPITSKFIYNCYIKKTIIDIYYDCNVFRSAIDQFFGGSFDVEWKCVENDTEELTKTSESFLQLSCFISQDVKYMHSGLKNVIT